MKKTKKSHSIEDFSECVPFTKEPSESISMPRIENDTPGEKKKEKNREIKKRKRPARAFQCGGSRMVR
jgi:hypothetical protein